MSWFTRLLWGDDRDHRLIKIKPPISTVSKWEPVNIRHPSFYSMYQHTLELQRQMMRAQQGMYGPQTGLGYLAGSSIGNLAGMLGGRQF